MERKYLIILCSTNEEEPGNVGDNQMVLHVPLEVNAQLSVSGRSHPEQVDYSIRNRTQGDAATFDFEIGPIVSHLFQVKFGRFGGL